MQEEIENIISNLIDSQDICYTSSLDENGYPVMRAMLAPRKREGIKVFYLFSISHCAGLSS